MELLFALGKVNVSTVLLEMLVTLKSYLISLQPVKIMEQKRLVFSYLMYMPLLLL